MIPSRTDITHWFAEASKVPIVGVFGGGGCGMAAFRRAERPFGLSVGCGARSRPLIMRLDRSVSRVWKKASAYIVCSLTVLGDDASALSAR